MIFLFFKAFVLVFLLKSGSMLTGGMSFWQQALVYTFISGLMKVLIFLEIIGTSEPGVSALIIAIMLAIIAVSSTVYFLVVSKVGGTLGTIVTIFGGAALVIFS